MRFIDLKLQADINKAIKMGNSKDVIEHGILRRDSYKNLDGDSLKAFKEELVRFFDEHSIYKVTQKLLCADILRDTLTGDYYFYDPLSPEGADFGRLNRISAEVLKDCLDKTLLGSRTKLCRFVEEPFNFNFLKPSEPGYKINLSEPPFWRERNFFFGEAIPNAELPKCYMDFFQNFTNFDDKSVQYLIDWSALTLKETGSGILAAVGSKGIGKTLYFEVMKQIHGKTAKKASQANLDSPFNSWLADATLVYLDEVKITRDEQLNVLKSVAGSQTISVTKKGKDAETVPNTVNFYLSSNNIESLRLDPSDRRFSIISLTNKRIDDWPIQAEYAAEGTTIQAEMLKQENIEALGRFLWHHKYPEWVKHEKLTTDNTVKVRTSSLNEWEVTFATDFCKDYEGQTLNINEVKEHFRELTEDRSAGKYITFRSLKKLQKVLEDICQEPSPIFSVRRPLANDKTQKVIIKINPIDKQSETISRITAIED